MEKYLVKPKNKINLSQIDPNDTSTFDGDKNSAKNKLKELNNKIARLQEILFAQNKHKLLVILQAMDTAGKDGVIKDVFEGVNPQGVKVANFKRPTEEELSHDYLWRVHKQTPGKGEIVIFNRSHYEDVLVVRVHNLASKEKWEKRYQHINEFEKLLTDEGTTIVKFFLHIDKHEQKERLQSRLDDTTKHWKFNLGDLKERELWDEYMKAYEDALNKTSTDFAPWYVIPSNKKWYRNLIVAEIIVDALTKMKLEYPKSEEDLSGVEIK
ncbi:MAG: polyphosphate kinase 2 family protein [Ignavibacteriales bacterium]|nr:polyphosphate kinase 2 family protein [Ignavibacteriales bacterium]